MSISDATFYKWRQKYGGLAPSELRRLRQLEEKNNKLKRLVADLSLDKAMLQDVLAKNVWSASHLQGSFSLTKSSLHKCIRPLASGLRLQPGHDEIRTLRSQ